MSLLRWLYLLALTVASTATGAPEKGLPLPVAQAAHEKQIDALFKEWDSTTSPGASVAVIDQGKIVFAKGYGIANLEYNAPIKPETIFHVASVSKQFTAMAVVLLEGEGKLSLDDDVQKYLPELPDYGQKITIRNLLQHTSGVRDQWQTLALAGWSLQDVITQDQILRMLFRQKELNFPPGSRHLYSNAGFTLLAEIVARVSGERFPQFCNDRIFAPLQMTHSHFHQDLTQVVPDRAYSYRKDGSGYAIEPLNYANVGATSLFTTATDLVKWLDNFRAPKVGGAAGIAQMQERGVLSDGTKIDYGLGLALGTYRGLQTVSHGGADAGYRSDVLWFPAQQLGVAVIANLASLNPDQLAKRVAEIYLADQMMPPEIKGAEPEAANMAMEPAELRRFAGVYLLPKIDQELRTVEERGKLWVVGNAQERLELHPLGPAHFYLRELKADIVFSPKTDGGMSVKVTQGDAVNEGDRAAPIAAAAAADFLPYTGIYWSEELETQYTFFLRDGTLFGLHSHHGEFALTPTIRDQFQSGQWYASRIKFIRDSKGNIAAVMLGGGRVSGVKFTRKPGGTISLASRASALVSGGAVAAILGRYDYDGPIMTISQEGHRVFAQLGQQPSSEILPKSETEYFWKTIDAQVTFVKGPDGKVISATHYQNGRTLNAPRMPDMVDIKLDDSQTDPLLGDYDAGSSGRLTISRESGHLFFQRTDGPRFELGALSDTEFYLKQWNAQITVIKDKDGKVTGVISNRRGEKQELPKLK
jgi:CubicO group peptidase (beta-lactamase class C family)